jgi:hypothetical protein
MKLSWVDTRLYSSARPNRDIMYTVVKVGGRYKMTKFRVADNEALLTKSLFKTLEEGKQAAEEDCK